MAFVFVRNGFRAAMKIVDPSVRSSSFLLKKFHLENSQHPMHSQNIVNHSTLGNSTFRSLAVTVRNYSKKHERNVESDSDSDDEFDGHSHHNGKKAERGNSEFWRRKMRTLHGILDVNNDGVISYDDYRLLAQKFADLGNLPPAAANEFHAIMKETWESQFGEVTPYNLVTAEQFLTDMHHALNDRDLVKKIHRFLPYFFKAVDKDHTGYLNLEQFKMFFNCLELSDEDAAVSFAVIDENGDGHLTIKEFVKLGKDYFLTEDERRVSRMFWGPLVNH